MIHKRALALVCLAASRFALVDRLSFSGTDGVASWLTHHRLAGHPAKQSHQIHATLLSNVASDDLGYCTALDIPPCSLSHPLDIEVQIQLDLCCSEMHPPQDALSSASNGYREEKKSHDTQHHNSLL